MDENNKIIGLYDVDDDDKGNINIYHIKKVYPNLALMKISAYYKQKGYKTEWYAPIFHNTYEKVFASKVFSRKTKKSNYLKKDMIIGGSGYDYSIKLPDEIEHIYPDYALYENIDYAMGFITRGCIRNCAFCIVPKKEGMIRKNADLEEFCKDQEKVMLLDNNFLAYKDHINELKKLIDSGKRIDFNQGIDIRLINDTNAKLLKQIRLWKGKRYTFAFDNIRLKNLIVKKLKILNNNGIKNSMINFFVLLGFDSTFKQDLDRLNFIRKRGLRAYAMCYRKDERYLMDLMRWANYKPFFMHINFMQFLRNKRDIKDKKKRDYVKKK